MGNQSISVMFFSCLMFYVLKCVTKQDRIYAPSVLFAAVAIFFKTQ